MSRFLLRQGFNAGSAAFHWQSTVIIIRIVIIIHSEIKLDACIAGARESVGEVVGLVGADDGKAVAVPAAFLRVGLRNHLVFYGVAVGQCQRFRITGDAFAVCYFQPFAGCEVSGVYQCGAVGGPGGG